MFHTDLLAVLALVVYVVAAVVGVWLVVRRDPAVPPLKRRRSSDPQAGRSVADGTGVERIADPLPRSPMANSKPTPSSAKSWSSQTPAAGDPRPLAAGPRLPVAAVDAPHAVATGHQPFDACSTCPASNTCARAGFCGKGTGIHRERVVLHG